MAAYYIASCVFTERFPALSHRIQNYVRERFGFTVVRCCVPRYKLREFEEKMPEGALRESWSSLPDCGAFSEGDRVFSLCHNCNNIIEETRPGAQVLSLWELIDSDPDFPFPDCRGRAAFVQDCWRSRDRKAEQEAVRSLLAKARVETREIAGRGEKTDFCGVSLYRPQPPRNPKLAPKHYAEGVVGKFIPRSPEEQREIMREYCRQFGGGAVVCYCHYCLEGLQIGGADAIHLAQLLFGDG